MISFDKLYKDLRNWLIDIFGRDRSRTDILSHMRDDVDDLILAVDEHGKKWITRNELLYEIADVQIRLFDLAMSYGLCPDSYIDMVYHKHQINKSRDYSSDKITHDVKRNAVAQISISYHCPDCRIEVYPENDFKCPLCDN